MKLYTLIYPLGAGFCADGFGEPKKCFKNDQCTTLHFKIGRFETGFKFALGISSKHILRKNLYFMNRRKRI